MPQLLFKYTPPTTATAPAPTIAAAVNNPEFEPLEPPVVTAPGGPHLM